MYLTGHICGKKEVFVENEKSCILSEDNTDQNSIYICLYNLSNSMNYTAGK